MTTTCSALPDVVACAWANHCGAHYTQVDQEGWNNIMPESHCAAVTYGGASPGTYTSGSTVDAHSRFISNRGGNTYYSRFCKRVVDTTPEERLQCITGIRPSSKCKKTSCGRTPAQVSYAVAPYCTGANMRDADNQICNKWRDTPATNAAYTSAVNLFCNKSENVNSTRCSDYCRANPGKCDRGIDTFCKLNPADKLCSCVNSSLVTDVNIMGVSPECFDPACKSTGYMTESMKTTSKSCPDINSVVCNQKITAYDSAVLDDINAGQTCEIESTEMVPSIPASNIPAPYVPAIPPIPGTQFEDNSSESADIHPNSNTVNIDMLTKYGELLNTEYMGLELKYILMMLAIMVIIIISITLSGVSITGGLAKCKTKFI